jgi:hypothetical protein
VGGFRHILPYVAHQGPALAAILVLTAVADGMSALQPWPLKILVDHALGGG